MPKVVAKHSSEEGSGPWEQIATEFGSHLGGEKLEAFRNFVVGASQNGRERGGPVREVLALVGDRWSGLLLQLLHYGPLRFHMLQRLVKSIIGANISRRVLAMKLHALERDGLVTRKVTPTAPPQVEYALNASGEELWAHVAQLVDWLNQRSEQIQAARQRFEQRRDTK